MHNRTHTIHTLEKWLHIEVHLYWRLSCFRMGQKIKVLRYAVWRWRHSHAINNSTRIVYVYFSVIFPFSLFYIFVRKLFIMTLMVMLFGWNVIAFSFCSFHCLDFWVLTRYQWALRCFVTLSFAMKKWNMKNTRKIINN